MIQGREKYKLGLEQTAQMFSEMSVIKEYWHYIKGLPVDQVVRL